MEEFTHNPKIFHIFAKLLDGKTATLRFKTQKITGIELKNRIFEITKIPLHSQRLISGPTQLHDDTILTAADTTVHLALRLVGGKGGFGSLLRGAATKAGQKKTNNFDACRDMSGRRLRHVNAEKRLEEWRAEEEERKLEKIAAEFIKKEGKKGMKGVGDGEAEKYVEKYREESERCSKIVLDAVREACGGSKRRKMRELESGDAKRLKIWMGKRKVGGSDSEDLDEDSSDDDDDDDVDEDGENEKSVVLNNGDHSDSSKDADGSSDSITDGKQNGEISRDISSMSGSEEDRETDIDQKLNAGSFVEVVHVEEVKPEVIVSKPDANDSSQEKSELHEEAVLPSTENCDMEKPLDFDEFNSAADLEVLGLERLKTELQNRGLKCGGSVQERAARLFMLKTTPLEKLPKKLFAKK